MPSSSDAAPDSARPFPSYGEALATLLSSLRDMAPLGRWMAARRDESGWTLLESAARESPPRGGEAAPELVCLRLAEDMRPRFIADAALMDDGPERRMLAQAGIAACILCPLISRRGELLGAIFATDAQPQPDCTPPQRRLVMGVARTLATLLAHSLRHEEPRDARLAGGDAFSTLPNLQAWMAMMEEEEAALVENDEEAMAVMIEVDEASHADPAESEIAMAHHAALLKTCLRDQDRVARIGRNRFALLLRNLDGAQAHAMLDKVAAALRHAGAAAVFGCALRRSCGTLSEAFRIADIRMYNEKLRHG